MQESLLGCALYRRLCDVCSALSKRAIRLRTYVCGVRYAELKIGEDYVLTRRGGEMRVTALKTKAEDVKRGKVRVRFSDSIVAGREMLQPLSMISCRWGEPTRSSTQTGQLPFLEIVGDWPPRAGDKVLWPSRTGSLEWTVIALDPAQPVVRIESRLFERAQEQTALINDLAPAVVRQPLPPSPVSQSSSTSESRERPRFVPAERPTDPQALIESLVDRMVFSDGVEQTYRARLASHVSRSQIDYRLRKEIITSGKLLRRHKGEYITLRAKRFEIRFATLDFRNHDVIEIDQIHIAPWIAEMPARKRRPRKPKDRR